MGASAWAVHATRTLRLQVGDGARGGEPAAEDEVLEGDVLRAPRVAGDGLLRHEAGRGEHAEAAVRELLLLHDAELGRVLRREAERIEAQIAGLYAAVSRSQSFEKNAGKASSKENMPT